VGLDFPVTIQPQRQVIVDTRRLLLWTLVTSVHAAGGLLSDDSHSSLGGGTARAATRLSRISTSIGRSGHVTIGDRIKTERTKAGISQAELARRVCGSRVYITKLETGVQSDPSLSVMLNIAKALGIKIGTLLRGL